MTTLAAFLLVAGATPALANPEALERARRLLVENNPKQAYMELIKLEGQPAGNGAWPAAGVTPASVTKATKSASGRQRTADIGSSAGRAWDRGTSG